jgi:hypothetical protein
MELIIDDWAVKVSVKKRKSMTDPAHSKLGTLPAAKGKEINNCQVLLSYPNSLLTLLGRFKKKLS